MFVHYGRHIDPPESSLAASCSTLPPSGTFVAVSVGQHDPLCSSSAATSSVSGHSTHGLPLYDQRCLAFAATRVATHYATPKWNEMLTLTLPADWRTANGSPLALRMNLVARGASQQEDFLLAFRALPLAAMISQTDEQKRVAWPLTASSPRGGTPPTVFVSVQEHSRSFPDLHDSRAPSGSQGTTGAPVRLELLVQSLSLSPSTPSFPLPKSLAALVSIETSSRDGIASSVPRASSLDSAFRASTSDSDDTSREAERLASLTAFATARSRSGPATYDWCFPLTYRLGATASRIDINVFGAANAIDDSLDTVAGGSLELDAIENAATRSLLAQNSGATIQLPPIPISTWTNGLNLAGDDGIDPRQPTSRNRMLVGHLNIRVRAWDASSWREFVRETPARRVVCSNRPANGLGASKFHPEWLGAVLRGLNRHPVASFCDEGGVTGVLAVLLGDSKGTDIALASTTGTNEERLGSNGGDGVSGSINQLLQDQLAHLTSESAAQRQQIERVSQRPSLAKCIPALPIAYTLLIVVVELN